MEVVEVIPAPESQVEFSIEFLNNSFGPLVPYVPDSDNPEFKVLVSLEAVDVNGKKLDSRDR